ncbi:MAG: hypothetical protein KME11_16710 [Timaviella obliquedivisa GSE-PSE-MK23-08B]|jgi:hypothetical protein|nr:hypothetical protein [Timaviella obliquedivisa GSE-PSE-MK23-08B]
MKFGLQRIGAMLEQLNIQSDEPSTSTASSMVTHPIAASTPQKISTSFSQPSTSPSQPYPEPQAVPPGAPDGGVALSAVSASSPERVQPFPVQLTSPLALPHAKAVSVSHHRHATNPNLAMSLLKDIETTVVTWQLELEQIILQIQAVYADGPIVEGWLESQASHVQSQTSASPAATATLRYGEVDRLMDYVEAICHSNQVPQSQATQSQLQPSTQPTSTQPTEESSCTAYRLCGLDADGRLWSRSCPTQQVPYVSLAIARYQKLRILLSQKQTLENRLNQLIQSLTGLSGQIQKS